MFTVFHEFYNIYYDMHQNVWFIYGANKEYEYVLNNPNLGLK